MLNIVFLLDPKVTDPSVRKFLEYLLAYVHTSRGDQVQCAYYVASSNKFKAPLFVPISTKLVDSCLSGLLAAESTDLRAHIDWLSSSVLETAASVGINSPKVKLEDMVSPARPVSEKLRGKVKVRHVVFVISKSPKIEYNVKSLLSQGAILHWIGTDQSADVLLPLDTQLPLHLIFSSLLPRLVYGPSILEPKQVNQEYIEINGVKKEYFAFKSGKIPLQYETNGKLTQFLTSTFEVQGSGLVFDEEMETNTRLKGQMNAVFFRLTPKYGIISLVDVKDDVDPIHIEGETHLLEKFTKSRYVILKSGQKRLKLDYFEPKPNTPAKPLIFKKRDDYVNLYYKVIYENSDPNLIYSCLNELRTEIVQSIPLLLKPFEETKHHFLVSLNEYFLQKPNDLSDLEKTYAVNQNTTDCWARACLLQVVMHFEALLGGLISLQEAKHNLELYLRKLVLWGETDQIHIDLKNPMLSPSQTTDAKLRSWFKSVVGFNYRGTYPDLVKDLFSILGGDLVFAYSPRPLRQKEKQIIAPRVESRLLQRLRGIKQVSLPDPLKKV